MWDHKEQNRHKSWFIENNTEHVKASTVKFYITINAFLYQPGNFLTTAFSKLTLFRHLFVRYIMVIGDNFFWQDF